MFSYFKTDLSRHISARKREEKQHEQTLSLRNKSANDNLTLVSFMYCFVVIKMGDFLTDELLYKSKV